MPKRKPAPKKAESSASAPPTDEQSKPGVVGAGAGIGASAPSTDEKSKQGGNQPPPPKGCAHTLHNIHLVEVLLELLLTICSLLLWPLLGWSVEDIHLPEGPLGTLLYFFVSSVLVVIYKWLFIRIEGSQTINSRFFHRLLYLTARHLPIPVTLVLLSYWATGHAGWLQGWLQKLFVAEQSRHVMSLLLGTVATSIWLSLYYGCSQIMSGEKKRIKDRFACALMDTYRRRDLSLLLTVQAMLRFSLIAVILVITLFKVVGSVEDIASPFDNVMQATYHLNSLEILGSYFVVAWAVYLCCMQFNLHQASKGVTPMRRLLLAPALFDTVFITLLACCIRPLPADWHLAYMLPVLGSWLFSSKWGVFGVGLLLNICLTLTAYVQLTLWLGQPNLWLYKAEFMAMTLPRLLFWNLILAGVLALRWLRAEETDKRKLIDAVADKVPYAVFAKDTDKKFVYMNDALYQALKANVKATGEDDPAKWKREEFYEKTDSDLKLTHASAYALTDAEAVNGEQSQKLEPNYDASNTSSPFVFTTKRPYFENGKDVKWIIGLCAEGTPHLVSEVIAESAPYCITLKDRKQHVRWANRRFLERDVNLEAVLVNWRILHPEHGRGTAENTLKEWLGESFASGQPTLETKLLELIRKTQCPDDFSVEERLAVILAMRMRVGATDEDLFGKAAANRYRILDGEVMSDAENDLGAGRNPVVEAIKRGPKAETHTFPCEGNAHEVQVHKIPWMSPDYDKRRLHEYASSRGQNRADLSKLIEGVVVFYHEK